MHNKIARTFAMMAFVAGSLVATDVMADCSEFGSDQWNTLSIDLADAYDKGDLETALKLGQQLTSICNESPIVNYTMSEIYRKMGNEDESYKYVRNASEHLKEYAVPQSLVERIWFRRAEFDTPYKETREKLAETEKKLAEAQAAHESDALHVQMLTSEKDAAFASLDSLNTIKWTGTGIAIGGVAIAGAGAALIGIYHSKADKELRIPGGGKFNDYNVAVQAGVGLLAAGVAVGIVGSVFAIYSHVKLSNANASMVHDDQTVSFSISPTSVGMQFVF